jgi:signal transduction histidine kinase
MKTDILQTLSEEIRNPLHSLLGLMTLTMATSTPVQREVLTQVRGDARQLLATIDSLIGLSDLGERGLQLDSVDLSSLVGEAVASATAIARERQITVAAFYEDETKETSAIGDAAAIRRILDNFLSDALRAARPGETVAVTVGRRGNTVTASVSDPGHGVSIGLVRQPAEQVSLDGTELMLSRRLAQAMKGSINAAHEAPNGTTVTLCLPAA